MARYEGAEKLKSQNICFFRGVDTPNNVLVFLQEVGSIIGKVFITFIINTSRPFKTLHACMSVNFPLFSFPERRNGKENA